MSLFASILTWSRRRPDWQRDALRRLVCAAGLGDDDVLALSRMCLARHGLTEVPGPEAAPIGPADLPLRGESSPRVVLTRVGDLANVNALAPAQELPFRPVGLTVVYGENGSGKSGYARVLKSACRARGAGERVLGNVRERCAEPPSAAIAYRVGDEAREHAWRAGEASPADLSEINVFDARTAPAFVEGRTDLAWRPAGLAILDGLAATCERVRTALRDEQLRREASMPPLPAFPHEGDVGRFLAEVTERTRAEDVRAFATLNRGEARELAELEQILSETAAARRRELRRQLDLVRDLEDRLYRIEGVLADDAIECLPGRARDPEAAPASVESSPSHADDVGTIAEPALEESRCPACGQVVPRRLQIEERRDWDDGGHFDVGYAPRAVAPAVRRAWRDDPTRAARLLTVSDRRDAAALEALRDPRVEAWQAQAAARRAWVLEGDWTSAPPPLPERPGLDDAIHRMDDELDALGSDDWIEDRWFLEQRRDQLRARLALADHVDAVMARVSWLDAKRRLASALQETDPAPIHRARVRLSRDAASDTLRAAFAAEIERLDLGHLGVTVEPARASKGTAYSQMRLHSPIGLEVAPGPVVSEGEHRCLALAAFLAELAAVRNRSGIVFDDPVAALDRTRRGVVATRLSAESAERQVVVFTHDLDFARQLRFEADRQGVPWTALHLRRDGGRPGIVEAGLPGEMPGTSPVSAAAG